jgi:hypothetical protein
MDRIARIRARRLRHEEEMLSVHWFTPALLAARWGVSETTVREIPATSSRTRSSAPASS